MSYLIQSKPTAVRHLADSTLFYFGSPSTDVHMLPGSAKFEIVYSPRPPHGWEFVQYQLFDGKSGVAVLGRRSLEADEIAHFEHLLDQIKTRNPTALRFVDASV